MRLIGVATVRNEADIFEAFARSNLRLLDELPWETMAAAPPAD